MLGNEAERLAALEAKLEALASLMTRMEGKLDAYQQNFISRSEYESTVKDLKEEIKELKQERQTSRQQIPQWVHVVLTVLTLGISLYIGGHKQ